MLQRTLVIFKPEVTQKKLSGELLSWLLRSGLKLLAGKFCRISEQLLREHYAEQLKRPGIGDGMERYIVYMASDPLWFFIFEGEDAIARTRALIGATMPNKAAAGTIRHTYGWVVEEKDGNIFPFNVVHASDSPETAELEIARLFRPEEIQSY